MPFQVHWSSRARRDLIGILKYCGEIDLDWAIEVDAAIREKLEWVAESPFLSSPIRRTFLGEIRETTAGNYRVRYSINEAMGEVSVIEIRHVRQNNPDFEE